MNKSYNRVRHLRKKNHLSCKDLARLLGYGSSGTISRIEWGVRVPSVPTLLAIGILFDASPDCIFPDLYGESEYRLKKCLSTFSPTDDAHAFLDSLNTRL